MILKTISDKLAELDPSVFYGMVDNSVAEEKWNYIVFNRTTLKPGANRAGYTYGYSVHIIREEFIPEGFEIEVINKMLEIPGMRLAGSDVEYTYTEKPKTKKVIEMASIDFVKPAKV